MSLQMILAPLFVQVVLTLVLLVWAGYLRVSAVRGGAVHPRDISLREPGWPPHVLKIINAYQNQLELPLLFYVLTILSIITRHADLFFVLMAWVFVVLRLMHAYVHVTDNHLGRRGSLFIAGAIVLTIMWVVFIIRIMLGLP